MKKKVLSVLLCAAMVASKQLDADPNLLPRILLLMQKKVIKR